SRRRNGALSARFARVHPFRRRDPVPIRLAISSWTSLAAGLPVRLPAAAPRAALAGGGAGAAGRQAAGAARARGAGRVRTVDEAVAVLVDAAGARLGGVRPHARVRVVAVALRGAESVAVRVGARHAVPCARRVGLVTVADAVAAADGRRLRRARPTARGVAADRVLATEAAAETPRRLAALPAAAVRGTGAAGAGARRV